MEKEAGNTGSDVGGEKVTSNEKTAVSIATAVGLTGISKILISFTKWESTVLFMLIFLCVKELMKE